MSKEIMDQLNIGDILLWTWSNDNELDIVISQLTGIEIKGSLEKSFLMASLSAVDDYHNALNFSLYEYHFTNCKNFECIKLIPYGSELFTDIIYSVNDQPKLSDKVVRAYFPELMI